MKQHDLHLVYPLETKRTAAKYRLVLSEQQGRLHGSIQCGNETVQPWTTRGIPTDIVRFLSSCFYYESSPRYFETFQRITSGHYPIIHHDEAGVETALTYRPEEPCHAGITFDIRENEIQITRTLDGYLPLAETAVIHDSIKLDLQTATLHPIINLRTWKTLEEIEDKLYALDDSDDEFHDNDDDWEYEDSDFDDEQDGKGIISSGIHEIPHGIAVTATLFNTAAIRFNQTLIANSDENFFFLQNGLPVETPKPAIPSFHLNIPAGISDKPVRLVPHGMYEQQSFPFSGKTFWLLNPGLRSQLSAPLKAKKRVRALLEAGFELLDIVKPTARNSFIRTTLSTPDFLKRNIKREAKQILTTFAEQCQQKVVLLRSAADGWKFIADDRLQQAKLLQIMLDLFGMDAFTDDIMPGSALVPPETLIRELPSLAGRLKSAGFSLLVNDAPLTTASWEFSLDATSSSLDWFELRPEIRCAGELLSGAELQELINGNGLLQRNGRLMLLDEVSAQVLAMFAGAIPNSKRKRKHEQEAVRVPRLQILDWIQLRQHGVTVKLSPDDARLLDNLLNFDSIPERPLPDNLTATMRHYQGDAYRWLGFLYEHRFGACLADDMGLGKTLQGIALLAGIMSDTISSSAPAGTPHLVVAPPSLLFNWESEITRFLPSARIMLYTGPGRSCDGFSEVDIIITSYGIIQRDIHQLSELRFNVMIFDETQVVKNLQAATTNAVRRLKGSFALALTGTPVENHLGEYYAIMDLCLPGLLGTREEFSRMIGQNHPEGTARLLRRTRPFVLRRTKQLIATELPPKIETDIQLELTTKQKTLYQRTVEEVRGAIREAYSSHAPAQARIIALTAILRLRQICLVPALAIQGASSTSPKLDFLTEQLEELRDEGHSALVFSQFTSYLDIIEEGLRQQGLNYLRLDGSTPLAKRKQLVQSFQNSEEPSVFLISLKAGGKGLNLTKATYVYHMDPWWNPAVENQASDRAHRIGQTNQVTITRLIMRHTIEEKMMALKQQKLKLYRSILEDGTGGSGAGLTRDDFEFLLG